MITLNSENPKQLIYEHVAKNQTPSYHPISNALSKRVKDVPVPLSNELPKKEGCPLNIMGSLWKLWYSLSNASKHPYLQFRTYWPDDCLLGLEPCDMGGASDIQLVWHRSKATWR